MTELIHLRGGGTSLLLDVQGDDLVIVHWGAELADPLPDPALLLPAVPHSMFDSPVRPSLIPQASRGWRGRPGVEGCRDDGTAYSPLLRVTGVEQDAGHADILLEDADAELHVQVRLRLDESGMLRLDAAVRNTGATPYRLTRLGLALPVPQRAAEVLDLTGRWAKEKQLQRQPIRQGLWLREGRHGRTGHDATGLLIAGAAGFGNRRGEVWGVHLAWSGDHEHHLSRLPSGQTTLGAAELLHPGEVVLAAGETYDAPTIYAAHSEAGLDGLSSRFHRHLRARPGHPASPRPVVLNTWEAVYFRHDLEELSDLAREAAAVGVERFVVDDGWFLGRRDDHRGLGDWIVDPDVWPDGLQPLIDRVEGLGMQFGLWVEPEMISEDSEVARAHPDWIAGPGVRRSPLWRDQQVIDLANPDAFAHVLGQLDDLLTAYPGIAYLKWDQNRDQTELGSHGRSSVHAQTLAAYRLFDELRRRHPGLEIESCSSGGARVDLGILQRTDRVWASDTNDALERQQIQRGTQLLLPPELIGAHIGPTRSHSTARTHDLSFRAATALIGHTGIEWDFREADDDDRAELARAIACYRERRALVHSGVLVHADDLPDSVALTGVVAQDRKQAVFVWAVLAATSTEQPPAMMLPGLDPARRYRVQPALSPDPRAFGHRVPPPWFAAGHIEATGAVLEQIGLPMPVMHPEHALVFDVEALA